MISFSVEFIGGPMDGSLREVEAEPSGPFVPPKPPARIVFEVMAPPLDPSSHIIPVEEVVYVRQVNDRDTGTLWVYVWVR